MRTWERARGDVDCGHCGRRVKKDEPIQLITFDKVARKLLRCETCADGPVNLEELERFDIAEEARTWPTEPPSPRRPAGDYGFKGVTRDMFDAKLAAAGRDE